jgi:hypothetical protein
MTEKTETITLDDLRREDGLLEAREVIAELNKLPRNNEEDPDGD